MTLNYITEDNTAGINSFAVETDSNFSIISGSPELYKLFTESIRKEDIHIADLIEDPDLIEFLHKALHEGGVFSDNSIRLKNSFSSGFYNIQAFTVTPGNTSSIRYIFTFNKADDIPDTSLSIKDKNMLLEGIISSAMDAIISINEKQEITLFNQSAEKMFLLPASKAVGRKISDLIPEEFRNKHEKHIENFGKTKVTRRSMGRLGTLTGRRYNGEIFPIEASISQVEIAGQKNYSVILRDISERQKTENILKNSEEKYRSLFETMAQGVVYQDTAGRIISANPAAERILGLTYDQLTGKTSLDPGWRAVKHDGSPFHGDEHPAIIALKTGNEVRNVIMGIHNPRDEQTHWISINAIPQFIPGSDTPFQVYATFEDITELKNVQDALQSERNQVQQYLDVAGVLILALNKKGRVMLLNKKGHTITGYSESELIGRSWFDYCIPQEIRDDIRKIFSLVMQGNNPDMEYYENPIITKDGQIKYIAFHNALLYDEHGNVTGVLCSGEDITESKITQEALKESEERFRATFEQAAVGVAHVSIEGKWLRVNKKLCDIVGYETEELLDLTFQDITHPDDLDSDLQLMNQLLSGEVNTYTLEKRYIRKDRSSVWISLTASLVRSENSAPKYFISVVEDISGRKWAEEQLKKQKDRMELLAGLSQKFAIAALENENLIETIAENYSELIGDSCIVFLPSDNEEELLPAALNIRRDQISGKPDNIVSPVKYISESKYHEHAFVSGKPLRINLFDDISKTSSSSDEKAETHFSVLRNTGITNLLLIPLRMMKKTIGLIVLLRSFAQKPFTPDEISFLMDAAGRAALSIVNAKLHSDKSHEIEERKKTEEKLKATLAELERSNQELEQFAYVASHDLQEPLRMVSSYTQLLTRRFRNKVLDESADEYIEFIVSGANRMQQLIQDLLEYSRVTTKGKAFKVVNTNEVLQTVLENLKILIAEKDAEVSLSELPEVKGDFLQLVQLFQNLISNGIKFNEGKPEIHVSCRKDGQNWLFMVSDNGIGIDKEFFDRIFVIFQRLHERESYPGTGIGLALCRKIVERHYGRIWVESEPGNGSAFYFTIPAI